MERMAADTAADTTAAAPIRNDSSTDMIFGQIRNSDTDSSILVTPDILDYSASSKNNTRPFLAMNPAPCYHEDIDRVFVENTPTQPNIVSWHNSIHRSNIPHYQLSSIEGSSEGIHQTHEAPHNNVCCALIAIHTDTYIVDSPNTPDMKVDRDWRDTMGRKERTDRKAPVPQLEANTVDNTLEAVRKEFDIAPTVKAAR